MKFKLLTKNEILISFDRLTRFKNTRDKYYRVFSEIISSNLKEPKYKKTELVNFSAKILTDIATEIINASLFACSENIVSDYTINNIIKDCENSTFYNDNGTIDFLNNKINYDSFVKLIDENSPINLKWLKMLAQKINIEQNFSLETLRRKENLKFPITKVLLVEGITEEILLPVFSNYLGFDFYKEGIQIIPAGGKNQVVKSYYKMSEELKIPIFILLDKDAEENIQQIQPRLRTKDKIHLVSCGEFEDLLPKSLIIKTVNNELNNFASVSNTDFDSNFSTVVNLEQIFKSKGLHEFKKSDFAKFLSENITEDSDISAEIAEIIMELSL